MVAPVGWPRNNYTVKWHTHRFVPFTGKQSSIVPVNEYPPPKNGYKYKKQLARKSRTSCICSDVQPVRTILAAGADILIASQSVRKHNIVPSQASESLVPRSDRLSNRKHAKASRCCCACNAATDLSRGIDTSDTYLVDPLPYL